MGDAEVKKERTTARRLFSRTANSLEKAVGKEDDIAVLNNRFKSLKRYWEDVSQKHEEYIQSITDATVNQIEQEDVWINELQERFEKLEVDHSKAVRDILKSTDDQKTEDEETLQKEELQTKLKEMLQLSRKAFQKRQIEEIAFNNLADNLATLLATELSDNNPFNTISMFFKEFKEQFEKCKLVNNQYIDTVEATEDDLKWITTMQGKYVVIVQKYGKFELLNKKSQVRNASEQGSNKIKLERMKYPHFEGDMRLYPRFKHEFNKFVAPEINCTESIAYVLRSCLTGEALKIVSNVDDDIDDMWLRLDDKFGKPTKLVDLIMQDIKALRQITDGQDSKFIDLVNIVEKGYRDLKRINFEAEMANSIVVSMIEAVLPRNIKREWSREVNQKNSTVDERNKFKSLLSFMLEQKKIIEYQNDSLRAYTLRSNYSNNANNISSSSNETFKRSDQTNQDLCLIHKGAQHNTRECNTYLSKSSEERVNLLKENGACFSCLAAGHIVKNCIDKQTCTVQKCGKNHHSSLHDAHTDGMIFHSTMISESDSFSESCLLSIMEVSTGRPHVKANVLWDGGATNSLITFKKAKELKLIGRPILLTVTKVGGVSENVNSMIYQVPLKDIEGRTLTFEIYGIEKISLPIRPLSMSQVTDLFCNVTEEEIRRPVGEVDILIGLDYAAFHPQIINNIEHLVLLQNNFGKCISGKHPCLQEHTKRVISWAEINNFILQPTIVDFFSSESLGVECNPKCGNCSCRKCPLGGKQYNLKEERELAMIEEGLVFIDNRWVSKYPWIISPNNLPNNSRVAEAMLKSTEKRLMKNPDLAEQYKNQINEMIDAGVAKRLSASEISRYKGPYYYIAHHEVIKANSTSTPLRIVFNPSAKYNGYALNDYWAKGPDFVNNLLGILLRFRENQVAFVGDIRRMYHSVKLSELDQHTHRFLWRDFQQNRKPDILAMTCVSFGDKPAAAISCLALRKTAEMSKEDFPEAAKVICDNSYVDDIIDSVSDKVEAELVMKQVEMSLSKAWFKIKSWSSTGDKREKRDLSCERKVEESVSKESEQKVLGIQWDPESDNLFFEVRLNFSLKKRKVRIGPNLKREDINTFFPDKITKRMILSQINGLFDPLGLITPFTVRAKILMRSLWCGDCVDLAWDDDIPERNKKEWKNFFYELFDIQNILFHRCIKPNDAVEEDPVLIIFCDGSSVAYGACAYIRWKVKDGLFRSNLICAKSRVAPAKTISIVRLELNGAVMAKRLKVFIENEMRLKFKRTYFLTDSQVVLAMLQKVSYGFQTFSAVRIGEIQESTPIGDWYWIDTKHNIADWVSRGKSPQDLQGIGEWQNGPQFLLEVESEWPIKQDVKLAEIPELIRVHLEVVNEKVETLANRIDIDRFSSYMRLICTTARILSLYQHRPTPSLNNALVNPTSKDLENAVTFWILDAQGQFTEKMMAEKFSKLSPKLREDGIFIVGTRIEKWLNNTYNENGLILLPTDHRLSKLYATFIHNICHSGIATTVSKIRRKYWIVNLTKSVKSIVNKCVACKKKRKMHVEQVMSPLPLDRLQPAPAWHSIAIDYFGPMTIRGEVNKRTRGTCFGVIFNSLEMRGVHLDVVNNCTTDSFLLALRRFTSIRGWPSKILSDNGTQFRKASKRLKDILKTIDWEKIQRFGSTSGTEWKFTPADGPWHNGCSEALIKSTKLAIKGATKDQILTFSELQTVVYEVANLLNERPIGRHPTNPDEGSYLCPNDLLLGRASSCVPSGTFAESTSSKQRFEFVQGIANSFWRKMTRDYFPSLIVRQKWHTERRNIKVNDIVMIQDSNAVRGEWRLGRVKGVLPSQDGLVRKCDVQYKLRNQDDSMPKKFTVVTRPVQRLIVLLPIEDQ